MNTVGRVSDDEVGCGDADERRMAGIVAAGREEQGQQKSGFKE
jgi:hypothetical protein